MKNIIKSILKIYIFLTVISGSITISQQDTIFSVNDGSLTYYTINNNTADSTGIIDTISNIRKISFKDTLSLLLYTGAGKSFETEYKYAKLLSITGKNNAGKTAGYGALIGFVTLGSIGFFSGLSESGGAGIEVGGAAIYGLLGGALGAGFGALIGLLIGAAGDEPDILDLSLPLTNTEKRNLTIKFLKRINL